MNIFEYLTAEQVNTVHKLYRFLRRLKIIGIVYTTTTQMSNVDITSPIRYKLRFSGYDHSMKNKLTAEERLNDYFISKFGQKKF